MTGSINAQFKTPTSPLAAAVASPLGNHVFFFVTQLDQGFRNSLLRVLEPFDLDIRQYTTMAYIAEGHTPTQHEVAQILHLDPSQVVKLINSLVSRGLLTRQTHEHDRRAKALQITPEGRGLYQQAMMAVHQSEEAVTSSLSHRDRSALKRLLHRILPHA